MNFGPQPKLEVQGKARHEAAGRRNSECNINLSSRNSLAAMAVSRHKALGIAAPGGLTSGPALHFSLCFFSPTVLRAPSTDRPETLPHDRNLA